MLLTLDINTDYRVANFICDELDAENSEQFAREIETHLLPGMHIIFDMKNLRFIDSSGLGVLLTCKRKLQDAGGIMKLCCLSVTVREILELVRLVRVFEIYDSREAAIQSIPDSLN